MSKARPARWVTYVPSPSARRRDGWRSIADARGLSRTISPPGRDREPFEVETWMPGVPAEQPIRLPSELPDPGWQIAIRRSEARRSVGPHSLSGSSSVALPAARSARASAASLLRASCEAENWRAQCSSSRSSSSSHCAIRSCSSQGRAASFAMATSRARVITRSIRVCADARPCTWGAEQGRSSKNRPLPGSGHAGGRECREGLLRQQGLYPIYAHRPRYKRRIRSSVRIASPEPSKRLSPNSST